MLEPRKRACKSRGSFRLSETPEARERAARHTSGQPRPALRQRAPCASQRASRRRLAAGAVTARFDWPALAGFGPAPPGSAWLCLALPGSLSASQCLSVPLSASQCQGGSPIPWLSLFDPEVHLGIVFPLKQVTWVCWLPLIPDARDTGPRYPVPGTPTAPTCA